MDGQPISLEEHFVATLSVNSLRKYRKHYKVNCSANSRKTLSAGVAHHFKNQLLVDNGMKGAKNEQNVLLNERDVLSAFISNVKSTTNSKFD